MFGAKRNQDGDPTSQFWLWFAEHAPVLSSGPPSPIALKRIERHLRAIHPELCFEIGISPDLRAEITISADGIARLFPVVEAVVAAAPEGLGWVVTAFRQAAPHLTEITIAGLKISRRDVYFAVHQYPDVLILDAFVRATPGTHPDVLGSAMFVLLDATVGERTAGTYLQVTGTEILGSTEGLVCLQDLPGLLVELGLGR